MSLLEDLSTLYSAVVADVMDERGYTNQTLSSAVRALTPTKRLWGRVFTMQFDAVDGVPEQPYALEMEAIDSTQPDDILLADVAHNDRSGIWGELLSTACLARGVRGIVMTGCTRDIEPLQKMNFGVFAIGTSPADSKGRTDAVAIREPITIDGVVAKQGDYILADSDGVVIIPQDIAPQIIAEAKAKVSGENTVREELAAGVPVAEVFRRHGIL